MSPSSPPEAPVSRVTRFGTAAFAGTVAALVASVPAALRVAPAADAHAGAPLVWLALSAVSLLPVVLAVAILRAARRGLAAFGGEGADARALGFVVWVFASTVALAILGAALRATTHHHALAGATFALVGLAAVIALAFVVRRLVAIVAAWVPLGRRFFLVALAGALGTLLLFFSVRIGKTASPAVGMLIDVLGYSIAAGFASRAAFARRRVLAIAGPPLAVLVLALGMSSLRSAAALPAAVRAHAPLLSPAVDCAAQLIRGR